MNGLHIDPQKRDPLQPRYVIMNNEKTSVLMVPYGNGGAPTPWWTYDKSSAELHLKILNKDFGVGGFVIEYRQAIVILSNHHAALAEQLKNAQ